MSVRRSVFLGTLPVLLGLTVFAEPSPLRFSPAELERLVDRIALYPDPLLAQVLAAATYIDQIPDAYAWADQHHYLRGQALADAIQADELPWDPSVQALLPFPSVLETMADDTAWTRQLGDAFLIQQPDVMDAVQRERKKARDYGYLCSDQSVVIGGGPFITIMPVDPLFMPVPWWDPAIVFFPSRPGIVAGSVIRFGYGVRLGVAFRPWGWGFGRVDWPSRVVIINSMPWRRTWENRLTYVHPYTIRKFEGSRTPEQHPLHGRTSREREIQRRGELGREEHRR